MPITASAKKALRRDQRRTLNNRRVRTAIKTTVKQMLVAPSSENLAKTFQVLDRAAKKHVIHDNKAARLKSRLSRLTTPAKTVAATVPASAKKTKKTPPRKKAVKSTKQ